MNTRRIFAVVSVFSAVAFLTLLLVGCVKSFNNNITLLSVTGNEISTSINTSTDNQGTGTDVQTKSKTSRNSSEISPATIKPLTSLPTTDNTPYTSEKDDASTQKSKSTTSRKPITSLQTSSLPGTSEQIATESKVSGIPSTSELSTDNLTYISTAGLPITTYMPITSQSESTSSTYAITSVGFIPHTEW